MSRPNQKSHGQSNQTTNPRLLDRGAEPEPVTERAKSSEFRKEESRSTARDSDLYRPPVVTVSSPNRASHLSFATAVPPYQHTAIQSLGNVPSRSIILANTDHILAAHL